MERQKGRKMRINIALFDKDTVYANRLLKIFQIHYAKQITLKVFSDEETFASELKAQFFDIAIIDQEFIDLRSSVPDRTVVALFVKDNLVEMVEQIPSIGKYQKVENIYKRIVGIYADNSAGVKLRGAAAGVSTILFTSAQGGAGTSSLAAGYAIYLAGQGQKVFYLNLETFGTANCFFRGDGNGSFSDVIYALKSKNVNLAMKLQSLIKRDDSGVEFVDECRNAFDMVELKDSEIPELLEGITTAQGYDVIVIDYSGTLTNRQQTLLKDYVDSVVYVSDGSPIGNSKFLKFCEAVRVIEKRENTNILSKMGLIYNRYSSKTSKQLDKVPIILLGGINRIEGIAGRDLVYELSKHEMMPNIS